jgi:hypothetical protein
LEIGTDPMNHDPEGDLPDPRFARGPVAADDPHAKSVVMALVDQPGGPP